QRAAGTQEGAAASPSSRLQPPLGQVVRPDLPGEPGAVVAPRRLPNPACLIGGIGPRLSEERGEELVAGVLLEIEGGEEDGLHAFAQRHGTGPAPEGLAMCAEGS